MSDGSNQTAAYHVLVQRNRFIDEEGMECAATGVQCHARLYFVRKKKKRKLSHQPIAIENRTLQIIFILSGKRNYTHTQDIRP
jgi:hypothetical protein